MEFSRPEYWSGQPFPSPGDLPNPGIKPGSPTLQADSLPTELSGKPKVRECVSCSVVSHFLQPHGLQPARLLCLWDSPGKNTGVDCHFLLQRIFPTQGLNPGLLHCRQILYGLSYREADAKRESPVLGSAGQRWSQGSLQAAPCLPADPHLLTALLTVTAPSRSTTPGSFSGASVTHPPPQFHCTPHHTAPVERPCPTAGITDSGPLPVPLNPPVLQVLGTRVWQWQATGIHTDTSSKACLSCV